MSRVHKFIRKPKRPSRPPVAVIWYPQSLRSLAAGRHENLNHPAEQVDDFKWKVFAQENLSLQPHETKTIMLEFGVELSMGVIIISLSQSLKQIRCSIQNESVVENTANIVISICNNGSDKDVSINTGDMICYLAFITQPI